ncbi:hypothetical protein OE88DRAFT_1736627 [Heliocybe sulcata]|uniref:DUF6533 domain-containing protein n=1 Tax=Heliocybe sulcata TaxID=5364 RepID=A0A5C3MWD1_9AGAM|nr:hypothetical protein OE88DRAFT_1736627 [Heliocybe sulcata]
MDPNPFVAALYHDVDVIRYCHVSAVTLTLFEHAMVLDQEVELIWQRREWSLTKMLYICNRYLGDAFVLISALEILQSNEYNRLLCTRRAWLNLVLRLHSSCSVLLPFLAWSGTVIWVVSASRLPPPPGIISQSLILGLSTGSTVVLNELAPGIRFCVMSKVSSYYWIYWLIVIGMESFIFLAVAWRAVQDLYHYRGPLKGRALFTVLVRDSFMFFLLPLGLIIADAIIVRTQIQIFVIPQAFTLPVAVIMSGRMVLNIREAYYHPFMTVVIPEVTTLQDNTGSVCFDQTPSESALSVATHFCERSWREADEDSSRLGECA